MVPLQRPSHGLRRLARPLRPLRAADEGAQGGGRVSNETRNPLGYLDAWRPYKKTQVMLARVQDILAEYEDHLPLTCRQIYYRMIGAFGYPKGEQFEDSLYTLLVNARRARIIPFESIRDDTIANCGGAWHEDVDGVWRGVDATLKDVGFNRQAGQPQRIEVWCEAAGMVPQLRKITHEYSIPVYSSGGFNSLTAIRQIVDDCIAHGGRIKEWLESPDGEDTDAEAWRRFMVEFASKGRATLPLLKPQFRRHIEGQGNTVVLHLGDFDPSGVSIFERVRDDVTAFLRQDAPALKFRARRVALIREQITEHGLPTDPVKTRDGRSRTWIRERRGCGPDRTHKCELEALPPDLVAKLLQNAIRDLIDPKAFKEAKRQEERDRSGLWYLRGVPDFEISPYRDFRNGHRQLGDFARRRLEDLDWRTPSS
jgi:hypothetical protein